MINNTKNTLRILTIGILSTVCFIHAQSYQEIANRMTIENYFTDQISDAIQTTVLDKDQFVVKVKVGLSDKATNTSQNDPKMILKLSQNVRNFMEQNPKRDERKLKN